MGTRKRGVQGLDPFPELVVLELEDKDGDAVLQVVVAWRYDLPSEDHLEIDVGVGLGGQVAASQHG